MCVCVHTHVHTHTRIYLPETQTHNHTCTNTIHTHTSYIHGHIMRTPCVASLRNAYTRAHTYMHTCILSCKAHVVLHMHNMHMRTYTTSFMRYFRGLKHFAFKLSILRSSWPQSPERTNTFSFSLDLYQTLGVSNQRKSSFETPGVGNKVKRKEKKPSFAWEIWWQLEGKVLYL